jgi:hypothetical protein
MTHSLPPLPLIDNCLFVDNSMLELLTTCPRALEYSKLHRRIGSASKPSLTFGSAIHHALEHRYQMCGSDICTALEESDISKVLQDFYAKPENIPPEDEWRNLNWCIEVFRHYNLRYKVEPFNLIVNEKKEPFIELPFALELCRRNVLDKDVRVMYCGRIDLPVLWDGQIIVIDHKTTSVLGDYFFKDQRISPQMIGYCYAFEQLTGQKVSGFCVNALRSKSPPAKPDGGFDKWWEESFSRHKEYIFPHVIDEWHNNVLALVDEFFWHYQRGYMPQKKKWCSGKFGLCSYYDVCDLPPSQRGIMLESNLFTENTWSPLKEPSQALQ